MKKVRVQVRHEFHITTSALATEIAIEKAKKAIGYHRVVYCNVSPCNYNIDYGIGADYKSYVRLCLEFIKDKEDTTDGGGFEIGSFRESYLSNIYAAIIDEAKKLESLKHICAIQIIDEIE